MGPLYNAINEKDELPYSLIDFLCKNFRCARNHKTNFFQWKCLMGNFENECHITSSIQLGGIWYILLPGVFLGLGVLAHFGLKKSDKKDCHNSVRF